MHLHFLKKASWRVGKEKYGREVERGVLISNWKSPIVLYQTNNVRLVIHRPVDLHTK